MDTVETPTDSWVFEEERIIICEGEHDKSFLKELIKHRNLPPFQVRHAAECNRSPLNPKGTGGVNGFGLALKILVAMTGFKDLKGIAIVTDNDDKSALSKVKRLIKKTARSKPRFDYKTTPSDHIIIIEGRPVLIVLVPDNDNYGDLETLCLPVLYCTWHNAKHCVDDFLESTGATKWKKQKQLPKAMVRSVISGHYEDDPYKGLGQLFELGTLCVLDSRFDMVANTLKQFDAIIDKGTL